MIDYFNATERDLFGGQPHVRTIVPIKPASRRRAKPVIPENSGTRTFTSREASALIIAAKASNERLSAGAVVPRFFNLAGQMWFIEKGCCQDVAASGMATFQGGASSPRDDVLALTDRFCSHCYNVIGERRIDAFMASAPPTVLVT